MQKRVCRAISRIYLSAGIDKRQVGSSEMSEGRYCRADWVLSGFRTDFAACPRLTEVLVEMLKWPLVSTWRPGRDHWLAPEQGPPLKIPSGASIIYYATLFGGRTFLPRHFVPIKDLRSLNFKCPRNSGQSSSSVRRQESENERSKLVYTWEFC